MNPIRETRVTTIEWVITIEVVMAIITEVEKVRQNLGHSTINNFNFRGGSDRGRCDNFGEKIILIRMILNRRFNIIIMKILAIDNLNVNLKKI